MEREEALQILADFQRDLHEQFEDPTLKEGETDYFMGARLEQFDAHVAVLGQTTQHLFDEHVRHRDRPKAHMHALGAHIPEAD